MTKRTTIVVIGSLRVKKKISPFLLKKYQYFLVEKKSALSRGMTYCICLNVPVEKIELHFYCLKPIFWFTHDYFCTFESSFCACQHLYLIIWASCQTYLIPYPNSQGNSNCHKISYTSFEDKPACANSADLVQTAPKEQSDHGLHCLPFHQIFCKLMRKSLI